MHIVEGDVHVLGLGSFSRDSAARITTFTNMNLSKPASLMEDSELF